MPRRLPLDLNKRNYSNSITIRQRQVDKSNQHILLNALISAHIMQFLAVVVYSLLSGVHTLTQPNVNNKQS